MRISDWSSDVCSADLVGAGCEHIAGKVLRSAHRTSEATRNASVRIEVPNKDDRLHAGDFVEVYFDAKTTANIDNKAATQLAVTTDAVLQLRSEEHTSELQSLMRISYAVFCLKKKTNTYITKSSYTR